MADRIQPTQILEAIRAFYDDLPSLLGEKQWPAARPVIDEWIARLAAAPAESQGLEASMELVASLSRYPNARERLRSELSRQQVQAVLGESQALDKAIIDLFRYDEGDQEKTRHVVINADGTGGGTSRKTGNLRLDVRRLLDIITDTATGAIGVLTSSHELAIVSGVLGVIRGINKAITIELTEKDARVFSALIEGHADEAAISEGALLELANARRKALGLAALQLEELRASLYILEQIQSVARVPEMPDHWAIVESYRIRGNAAAR